MLQNADKENKFTRVQYAETRLEPIWECLVAILKDPDNVIPRLEEYTFKSANEGKALEKIKLCDKQLASLQNQRTRIVRAFIDGGLQEKEYEGQLAECVSRILESQRQKAKFQQLLVKREERKDRGEVLKALYTKIQARLENPSYEDKKYILQLFVERINLFHKHNYAEVFFRFPASIDLKQAGDARVVSQKDEVRLVLHVKTLSETERSREILLSNINRMYTKKAVA